MKKKCFFALVMFMSIIGAVFGQTPATLPYSCDFEASGGNGWTLKNGSCANKWHVGSFTSPAGHSGSLFISSDGGTTADYNIDAKSVVVAEKLFQTGTSDSLTISFDLTIGGENASDYLKVYWVNADTVYDASTSWPYYSNARYSTNIIMSNAAAASYRFVNLLAGTQNMSATIANEPNTLKKLVFVWTNDYINGTQPGAIIDNISIIATPTPLPYSCDFEAAGYNGWILKNGTCTSQWHVGSFTSPAGYSGSLFISSDGGTTADYGIDAVSVVVAEKLFQTGTSDSLTISFDLTIGGEEYRDYLKVFWVPADTVYEASFSTTYFSKAEYSTNVIMRNSVYASNYTLTHSDGEERMSVTIANEPNTLKKLVFVWRSDIGGRTQPGAIIDNISIIATPTHTPTPTPLPYSCDFEASGGNGWTLKNGSCANKWHVGSFTSPAGYSGSLFISGNNGQTPEYNPDAYSVVVAEKTFQTGTSDSLTISFDLTSEGETNDDGYYVYDYLKVFWVPADTVYGNATSATYYSNSRYSTNVIMSNSPNALNYTLNYSDGEERMSVTIANEPNTLKKLVFVWVNDENGGSSPGAIIDNISIIATHTPTPTPLPYSCDFEAAGDNGWTLKNGSCVNKWAIANYPDATNKVLAITANSTVGYDIDERSVVVAEKLFQTGAGDSLTISFSVEVGGEAEPNGYDAYDYLKVFWVPADTVYEASTSIPYYASGEYSTNILTSNNSLLSDEYIFLDVYNGAESVTIANEPYSLKKLVFVWVNDGGEGSSDGAIIDNISITLAASGLADAESGAIKAMIYPNPAKDKATLSLSGLTANAKIIVSDLQGRIIQTEDLQAGTETYELNTSNYASGVYYIRILCGNNSNTQKLIIE